MSKPVLLRQRSHAFVILNLNIHCSSPYGILIGKKLTTCLGIRPKAR